MKIRFKGIVAPSAIKTGGCSACGKPSVNTAVEFQRSWKTILLDGKTKQFDYNVVYDIDERSANYLLNKTYQRNGETLHAFEEV